MDLLEWMPESGIVSWDGSNARPVLAMFARTAEGRTYVETGVVVLDHGQLVHTQAGRLQYPGAKSQEWSRACVDNGYGQ